LTNSLDSFSRHFADKPDFEFLCPTCKRGTIAPDQSTFKQVEPPYSEADHSDDGWDPFWITYRFSVTCVCNRPSCGEVCFVAGIGGVDQRYGYENESEYYTDFVIKSFYPSPDLIVLPKGVPREVTDLLEKSFALFWVDVSAAANSLRASLEALLDTLKIPKSQATKSNSMSRLTLHARLDIWAKQQSDYAELCFALKEVGNLGSHGGAVREEHYFGALEIFQHVLNELYENNAQKMKALAKKIQSEIKGPIKPQQA
jgi:hypothetical protein